MSFGKSFRLAIGITLLFGGIAASQSSNVYTFSQDVEVTEAPPDDGTSFDFYSSGQHYTAFRGDTVYVVWGEGRSATPPTGNHVFFAKSTDGGQTFGPNVRVNSTAAGFNPSMRVDSAGIVYVAYERQGNIFFTKSTDGGNIFTVAVQVIDSIGLPFTQELPSIAVNNKGQVFISWIDHRTDPQSVFIAASFDTGKAFSVNIRASDSNAYVYSNDIAADDDGHVFVVWPEFVTSLNLPLRLARSDDSGSTFFFRSTVSDLPIDTGQVYALSPSLSVENGGLVGVVWEDKRSGQYSLHFSKSENFSQNFAYSTRVDNDNDLSGTSSPVAPSLIWRNNMFYVSWIENRIRPPDSYYTTHIFFSYTVNGGQTFASNTPVVFDSNGFFLPLHPGISVNEKREVSVAWLDDRHDPFFQEIWHVFAASGKAIIQKGDLNLDAVLSATDIVMELNAVFLGQSFPAPFETADGNCDHGLTAADIVLQLNATFSGLPFPC